MGIFIKGKELAIKSDIISRNYLIGTSEAWKTHSNNAWNVYYTEDVPVIAGEIYTASVDVNNSLEGSTKYVDLEIGLVKAGNIYKNINDMSNSNECPPNAIKRIYTTFVVPEGAEKVRVHTRAINDTGISPYQTKCFKLERGRVATPWCPAYEDYAMKSDIEALSYQLQNVMEKIGG